MIHQISDNLSFLHDDGGNGILVSFSHRDSVTNVTAKISYRGTKEGKNIRLWGQDNNLPQYREQIIADNNIVATLLKTQRDITFGSGLFAYKPEFIADDGIYNIVEVPTPDVAQEFFDKVDIDEYLILALKEEFVHSNVFTEFARNEAGGIDNIVCRESKYTRLGEQDANGIIKHAYLSGAWATGEYKKDGETAFDRKVIEVPMYKRTSKQKHFIMHTGDRFLNDGYYNSPTWWGSRPWIELANTIPLFHQSNMKNGYTIRYHIQIPKGYCDVKPETQAEEHIKVANDKAQMKKADLLERLNDLLAGTAKAGRAFISEYDIEAATGKEYPSIKIEAINVDLKDKALLDLFEKSNTANISSQGIHPVLANIETQGKLSSGSEIRNAFIMWLKIKTPIPRKNILKVINFIKKENGWPADIFYGFRDVEITNLDESKEGSNDNAAVLPDNNTGKETTEKKKAA